MIKRLLLPSAFVAVLLTGAIFGFFYAWVCSTMWGLDAADPKVAIAAMQAMNVSVRNPVFAPAFFFTPFVLLATAIFAWILEQKPAAHLFGAAGCIYLLFGLLLTVSINVPMNNALALVKIPKSTADAQILWTTYSQDWQMWNIVRTIFSGISLLLATMGIYKLNMEKGVVL